MTTRLLLALAILLSVAACKIGGGETITGPASDCRPSGSTCGANAECCSFGCEAGLCAPNPVEGGACRTSDDCLAGLCKSGACAWDATCRDDADVCSGDYGCCSGNCVGATYATSGACQPNHAPVADVGLTAAGPQVPYRQPVPLRNDSFDPDAGDVPSFEWTVVEAPAYSVATIQSPTSRVPSFVPDRLGPYTLQVRIVDGPTGQPGRLAVVATVSFEAIDTSPVARPRATNTSPVAVPGTVGHLPRRSTVALDGSTSSDPDGDAVLSMHWEIVSQPAGGEAILQNPDSAAASLVLPASPAPEGDYVVRLTVSNAKVGAAELTIHADDTTPVATLTAPAEANNLTAVTLDASGSSDADQDVLAYAWETTAAPAGSVAAPVGAGATATFTPDLPGAYTLRVTVSDPALHVHAASRSVTVHKAVRDLGHRVVDAEYSAGLDRIVAVGPHPDTAGHPGEGVLDVFDPKAATQSPSAWVALPKAPTCVGLSPDGRFAVVGHAKAISYVDVAASPPAVLATIALNYDVSDAVLGDPRSYKGSTPHFAHFLFSGAPSNQPLQTVILTATPEIVVGTSGNYVPPTARLRIRPEPGATVSRLFVAVPSPATNPGWWGYNIDSNTGATYGGLQNWPLSGFSAGAWVAEDGSLAFNENGRVYYGRSSGTTTELLEAGVLGASASAVEWIDHSSEAGLVLAIDGVTQQTLRAYGDTSFGLAWSATLPRWVAKGAAARGRFAFFDAAGAERYAIVASTTGTADTDAALVVYCPDAQGVDLCP